MMGIWKSSSGLVYCIAILVGAMATSLTLDEVGAPVVTGWLFAMISWVAAIGLSLWFAIVVFAPVVSSTGALDDKFEDDEERESMKTMLPVMLSWGATMWYACTCLSRQHAPDLEVVTGVTSIIADASSCIAVALAIILWLFTLWKHELGRRHILLVIASVMYVTLLLYVILMGDTPFIFLMLMFAASIAATWCMEYFGEVQFAIVPVFIGMFVVMLAMGIKPLVVHDEFVGEEELVYTNKAGVEETLPFTAKSLGKDYTRCTGLTVSFDEPEREFGPGPYYSVGVFARQEKGGEWLMLGYDYLTEEWGGTSEFAFKESSFAEVAVVLSKQFSDEESGEIRYESQAARPNSYTVTNLWFNRTVPNTDEENKATNGVEATEYACVDLGRTVEMRGFSIYGTGHYTMPEGGTDKRVEFDIMTLKDDGTVDDIEMRVIYSEEGDAEGTFNLRSEVTFSTMEVKRLAFRAFVSDQDGWPTWITPDISSIDIGEIKEEHPLF